MRQAFAGIPRDADHRQTGTSAGGALKNVIHGYGEFECNVESLESELSNAETGRSYTVGKHQNNDSVMSVPANGIPDYGGGEDVAAGEDAVSRPVGHSKCLLP